MKDFFLAQIDAYERGNTSIKLKQKHNLFYTNNRYTRTLDHNQNLR